jgi:hypothetical protein
MLLGGLAVFVHAIFPFLFTSTGSGVIASLHSQMITHRKHRPALRREHIRGRPTQRVRAA